MYFVLITNRSGYGSQTPCSWQLYSDHESRSNSFFQVPKITCQTMSCTQLYNFFQSYQLFGKEIKIMLWVLTFYSVQEYKKLILSSGWNISCQNKCAVPFCFCLMRTLNFKIFFKGPRKILLLFSLQQLPEISKVYQIIFLAN